MGHLQAFIVIEYLGSSLPASFGLRSVCIGSDYLQYTNDSSSRLVFSLLRGKVFSHCCDAKENGCFVLQHVDAS